MYYMKARIYLTGFIILLSRINTTAATTEIVNNTQTKKLSIKNDILIIA